MLKILLALRKAMHSDTATASPSFAQVVPTCWLPCMADGLETQGNAGNPKEAMVAQSE